MSKIANFLSEIVCIQIIQRYHLITNCAPILSDMNI